MKKLKKKQKLFLKNLCYGLSASLVIHGLILFFLFHKSSWFFPKTHQSEKPLESTVVETQLLSENEFKALMNKTKHVVETLYVQKQVDDFKKSLFLSEKKNRVEKEMRSAQTGSIFSIPMKQSLKGESESTEDTARAADSSLKGLSTKASGKLERGDQILKNDLPFGTMDSLDKNIAIGPQTILNTDEYLYSSFYNRFRYQVFPSWDPRVRKALQKKPQLGSKDYFVTSTVFLVGKDGLVKKVIIQKSSGITEFDEAAVASLFDIPAINNPPSDLLNKDGLYEIRLQFIIELQRQNLQVRFQPPQKVPRHF